MSGQSYRGLAAWQKAIDLVEDVYVSSRRWPAEERHGLTSQTRRAVVSIPANIAEGQGRDNEREFHRFVSIANGSLYELETHLTIAGRLGFLDQEQLQRLSTQTAEVGRLIPGLKRHLRGRINP
ncbi:MAG: four helix bundle protein [Thermomicrobiales bacterium]